MSNGMRWAGMIALALFGLAGLGIVVGEVWMANTLARVRDVKPPSVRFVEYQNGSWQRCAGPSRAPASMAEVEELIAASSRADLRQAVMDRYACCTEDDRTAFVRVLTAAGAQGHRIALAALDAIARDGCATLLRLDGGDPTALDANIQHCVAALPRPDGTIEEPEGIVGSPLRTARFAQLIALLQRGNPAPSVTTTFCDDAAALDAGVLSRFIRQHPTLPDMLQQSCGNVSPPPREGEPPAPQSPEDDVGEGVMDIPPTSPAVPVDTDVPAAVTGDASPPTAPQ